MSERITVNIYYNGLIPVLNINGPVYNRVITRDQFNLLRSMGVQHQVVSITSSQTNLEWEAIQAAEREARRKAETFEQVRTSFVVPPVVLEKDLVPEVAEDLFVELLPEEYTPEVDTSIVWALKDEAELKQMSASELKKELEDRFGYTTTGSPTRASLVRKYLSLQQESIAE